MKITGMQSALDNKNDYMLEFNETSNLLLVIDNINQGGNGWFGRDKKLFRDELLERAKNNDGKVSAREMELIDKAMDSKLTPAERDELINLLPEYGWSGKNLVNETSAKSNEELVDEVRELDTEHGFNSGDFQAIRELYRRASQDGKVSAELDSMFQQLFAGKELSPFKFVRFRQLLHSEDNLV